MSESMFLSVTQRGGFCWMWCRAELSPGQKGTCGPSKELWNEQENTTQTNKRKPELSWAVTFPLMEPAAKFWVPAPSGFQKKKTKTKTQLGAFGY